MRGREGREERRGRRGCMVSVSVNGFSKGEYRGSIGEGEVVG